MAHKSNFGPDRAETEHIIRGWKNELTMPALVVLNRMQDAVTMEEYRRFIEILDKKVKK